LWLLVRAAAWRTLLQQRVSISDAFFALCEGYLMNNVLPFRLGEVGRAYLVGRRANLGFWQVLPTIIIERAIDVALGVGLFISMLPFVVGVEQAPLASLITGILVVCGLGFLYALARYRSAVEQLIENAGQRWPWLQRLLGQRVSAFLDGLAIMANLGLFLRSLSWMLLNWGMGILQFYFYVRAFFPQGELLWAAFILGALALGISAPSTPGSLGVYEGTLVAALALFVDDPSQSLAMALTAHAIQYIVTGIPGIYGLYRDGESLSSLYQKARSTQ
jgi:hypothetical protein